MMAMCYGWRRGLVVAGSLASLYTFSAFIEGAYYAYGWTKMEMRRKLMMAESR